MTKTSRSILSLILSAVVLLFLTVATSLQNTAFAATVQPATGDVIVSQTVEEDGMSAEYRIVPVDPDSPLPDGAENGAYSFVMRNASEETISIIFTSPGNYEYQVGVYEDGDFVESDDTPVYEFGFCVTRGENHTLNIQPYSCVNPYVGTKENSVLLSYNLNLVHPIVEPDEDETEQNTNDFPANPSTTKTASSASTIKAAYVNTNDPTSILLWVGTLAFGAVGFMFFVVLRRRSRDDEEDTTGSGC